MPGHVSNTSVSPSLNTAQPTIRESSTFGNAVDKDAKDIHQTTKTELENQGFGMLTIVSWGKWVVNKCGLLVGLVSSPFILLVSPFLFIYDGFRGVTLLCRKIAKIETPVEKLMPKADKLVNDVDQILSEKTALDPALQDQVEHLKAGKEQSDQRVKELQLSNYQAGQNMVRLRHSWEKANTGLRAIAGSAEQRASELARELEQVSTSWNEADQEYQTEKDRLSIELKQLKVKLGKRDGDIQRLNLQLVKATDAHRKEESDNNKAIETLVNNIDELEQKLKGVENERDKLVLAQKLLIEKSNKNKSEWQSGCQRYIYSINSLNNKINDLQARNAEGGSSSEVDGLIENLREEMDLNNKQYIAALKILESDKEQLTDQVNQLNAVNLDLQKERVDAEGRHKESSYNLQEKIKGLNNDLEELRCKMAEGEKRFESDFEGKTREKIKARIFGLNQEILKLNILDSARVSELYGVKKMMGQLECELTEKEKLIDSLRGGSKKDGEHVARVNALNAEAAGLRCELNNKQIEIDYLKEEIIVSSQDKESELRCLNGLLKKADDDTNQFQQELDSIQRKLREEESNLKSDVVKSNDEIDKLKDKIRSLETEIQRLRDESAVESDRLQKSSQESRSEINNLKSELAEKVRQISVLNEKLSDLENKYKKSQQTARVDRLNSEAEGLRGELNEKKAEIEALEKEITISNQNKESEANRFNGLLKKANDEISSLKQEVERVQRERRETESGLESVTEKFNDKIERLAVEARSHESDMQRLKRDSEVKSEQLQKSLKESESKIYNLKSKLGKKASEVSVLNGKLASLEKTLSEKVSALESLDKKYKKSKQTFEMSKKHYKDNEKKNKEDFDRKLFDLSELNVGLEGRIEKIQIEKSGLELDYEKAKREWQDLINDYKVADTESSKNISILEHGLDKAKTIISDLEKAQQQKAEEIVSLKSNERDLENKIKGSKPLFSATDEGLEEQEEINRKLRAELREQKANAKELEKNLNDYVTELNELKKASGESDALLAQYQLMQKKQAKKEDKSKHDELKEVEEQMAQHNPLLRRLVDQNNHLYGEIEHLRRKVKSLTDLNSTLSHNLAQQLQSASWMQAIR